MTRSSLACFLNVIRCALVTHMSILVLQVWWPLIRVVTCQSPVDGPARHVTRDLDTTVSELAFHWAVGPDSAFDVKFCWSGMN